MSANTTESNSGNSQTGACHNDVYVYEIRKSNLRNLCFIIDDRNLWPDLAMEMGYQTKVIDKINEEVGNGSRTDLLIDYWGNQNHKVTELFMLLYAMKLYPAMQSIREYVDKPYHRLIPDDQHPSTRPAICSGTDAATSSPTGRCEPVDDSDKFKDVAGQLPRILYEELKAAADDWNPNETLGQGGFAIVFKGIWKHTEVAIKRIGYRGAKVGKEEALELEMRQILNELKHLNSCRHDNILPLYGWSYGGGEPCLVYQFMPGRSLQWRLDNRENPLTFYQRVQIAAGTARGLQFLHSFSAKPLIHCDIKPANILLDACCIPKIGDFGLAREGSFEKMKVSKAFGTEPFLPFEFVYHKQLSTKVDTYSFGVVLFALMTGLEAYDESRPGKYAFLAQYIPAIYKSMPEKLYPMRDRAMELDCVPMHFWKIIQCGILCTHHRSNVRPEMVQVMKFLATTFKSL